MCEEPAHEFFYPLLYGSYKNIFPWTLPLPSRLAGDLGER